jgi:hypothetical protein
MHRHLHKEMAGGVAHATGQFCRIRALLSGLVKSMIFNRATGQQGRTAWI